MQIFVKGNSTQVVDVEETATVFSLKERICKASGADAAHQVLSFGGKILDDTETVGNYGVCDGITVYSTLRMRGGRGQALDGAEAWDFFEFTETKPALDTTFSEMAADDEWALSDDSTWDCLGEDSVLTELDSDKNPSDHHCEEGPVSSAATPSTPPENESPSTESESTVGAKRSHEENQESEETARQTAPQRASKARKTRGQPPAFVAPMYHPPFPMAGAPFFAPVMPVPQRKGVAYDLDMVDEKTRKRLLKNRRSAERSRQKKNAQLLDSSEQLKACQEENAELQREQQELEEKNSLLERQNEAMRVLLQAHGITFQ